MKTFHYFLILIFFQILLNTVNGGSSDTHMVDENQASGGPSTCSSDS